uniref:Cholecystokinin a n=1 Tax=Oryzias sinensis TaxID=183150 RepID=A0A8C7XAQ4_9TELE
MLTLILALFDSLSTRAKFSIFTSVCPCQTRSHECRNLRVCYPGCSFHWLSNSTFKVPGRTHKRKNNVVFSPSVTYKCVRFLFQRTERKALVTESLPVPLTNHTRQARSAPAPPSGQLQSESAQNSLSQLLARLLSRKSSSLQTRSSLTSRAAAPSHRIKDRDYLGWMDFGRRSVEEYEYSP